MIIFVVVILLEWLLHKKFYKQATGGLFFFLIHQYMLRNVILIKEWENVSS